jgi:hypothetical protein
MSKAHDLTVEEVVYFNLGSFDVRGIRKLRVRAGFAVRSVGCGPSRDGDHIKGSDSE